MRHLVRRTRCFHVVGILVLTAVAAGRAQAGIKLLFDMGDPTPYAGTNSPGHVAGAFGAGDTTWNTINPASGNITGLKYSDGTNAAGVVAQLGQPFYAPYTPPTDSSWNYGGFTVNYTSGNPGGYAIYGTSLVEQMLYRPNPSSIGFRVSGLAAGDYGVYVISVHPEALTRTYSVSVGVNLEVPVASPTAITAGSATAWTNGANYHYSTVTLAGPSDWVSVIVADNFPIFNGLGIVEVPEPATLGLLAFGGAMALGWRRRRA